MAQPQHTRNDPHNSFPASYYEDYTKTLNSTVVPQILNANPYPSMHFDTARQYWHSVESATDHIPRYLGMAEYSSNNFITIGTPYSSSVNGPIGPNAQFPLPNGTNASDGTAKSIQRFPVTVNYKDGSTATIPADFVVGKVFDPYMQSVGTVTRKLAVTSVFDTGTTRFASKRVYGVSKEVFDEGYSALLPRAVGFSAGLMDHLFRGRIDLRRNTTDNKWVVENRSRSARRTMPTVGCSRVPAKK